MWVRLGPLQRKSKRTAWQSFWAKDSKINYNEEEKFPTFRPQDLEEAIAFRLYLKNADFHESLYEELLWTVSVSPSSIREGRIAVRDYVLTALGTELVKNFSPYTNLDITVELGTTTFTIRATDLFLQSERRRRQCFAACRALRDLGFRARGRPIRVAYDMTARILYGNHLEDPRWDEVVETDTIANVSTVP